jgi:O-succinylbenzoate synthase
MSLICKKSQVPIALDEELIGITDRDAKQRLLEDLEPQHIVLKPSLLGGFMETSEWIDIAEKINIGWWITSALESNLGLNAISQFVAQYSPQQKYQGLGTGKLYHNNLDSKAAVEGQFMKYHPLMENHLPL